MLPTAPGTQKKYRKRELLFLEGVSRENDLGLKRERCPDMSELRGHVSLEFKRINAEGASWGPGFGFLGFRSWGEGQGGSQGTWFSHSSSGKRGEALSLV